MEKDEAIILKIYDSLAAGFDHCGVRATRVFAAETDDARAAILRTVHAYRTVYPSAECAASCCGRMVGP